MPAAETGAESDGEGGKGTALRTPGLSGHIVCCWDDGGGCILRLQQAVIWDAQTDADWINETGKQPLAEGSLHVRLLFAETGSDVCIVLSVYLAYGIGCFLLSCGQHTGTCSGLLRRTCFDGSFRTSAIRLFLWVVYLVASVCVFWGGPEF